MKQQSIRLAQLAYKLDIPDSQWYSTVAEAAAVLTPGGVGAMVYAFDASAGTGVQIPSWGSFGVTDEFVAATIELNRRTTAAEAGAIQTVPTMLPLPVSESRIVSA